MYDIIKNIISGLAAFLRLKERRQELDNTPEMQANERAKTDAKIRDAATDAVKRDNLAEIRRQAGE